MSLSCRTFLLTSGDVLYRLPQSIDQEMVCRSPRLAVPSLANQRVRFAELLVELVDRKPVRVVRSIFYILAFDPRGAVDVDAHRQYCVALLAASLGDSPRRHPGSVADAKELFVAAGGKWNPTRRLEYEIVEAALGNRKVQLLSRRDAIALDSA